MPFHTSFLLHDYKDEIKLKRKGVKIHAIYDDDDGGGGRDSKHCREVLRFLVFDAWIGIFIPLTCQLCDLDR